MTAQAHTGAARRVGNHQHEPALGAPAPPAVDLSGLFPQDPAQTALKLAIDHIEHMAAFITSQNAGYSFEALGEDMATIKAGLK